MDYYRKTYFPEKMAYMQGKLEKEEQEVMYSSKYFNSNYVEFVSYDTCEKNLCTSGEGRRITNKIIIQGSHPYFKHILQKTWEFYLGIQ